MNDFMDADERKTDENYEDNLRGIHNCLREMAETLKSISDNLQSVINVYSKAIRIDDTKRK